MGEFNAEQCALVVELCAAKLADILAMPAALRDLRAQVRGRMRSRSDARTWAAGVLGLVEWPGTDALSEEQLRNLLAASAAPPRKGRTSEALVRRLSAAEIELLRAVTRRGNFGLRRGDAPMVARMIDLNLLEKHGFGVRPTALCGSTLALLTSDR